MPKSLSHFLAHSNRTPRGLPRLDHGFGIVVKRLPYVFILCNRFYIVQYSSRLQLATEGARTPRNPQFRRRRMGENYGSTVAYRQPEGRRDRWKNLRTPQSAER